MTPQTLLKETQRAAGNENLTTWHEALIRSGQELKELEGVSAHLGFDHSAHSLQRITSDKEKLVTLKDRNATLEKEVKRFEERQALENKARALSSLSTYPRAHISIEKPFGSHLAFRGVQTCNVRIPQQERRTSPAPRKIEGPEEETSTYVATERV